MIVEAKLPGRKQDARTAVGRLTLTAETEQEVADLAKLAALEGDGIVGLLARIAELEAACNLTIEENLHLADGENCTLIRLKRAINWIPLPE